MEDRASIKNDIEQIPDYRVQKVLLRVIRTLDDMNAELNDIYNIFKADHEKPQPKPQPFVKQVVSQL